MKYYIGVGRFHIVKFNPDKEWLVKKGFKVSEEPVYHWTDRGVKYCKVVACMMNEEFNFMSYATFTLKEEILKSKAGKFCFVNGSGMINWAEEEEKLPATFFQKDTVFNAHEGEPVLFDFLKVLLNGSEDKLYFDRKLWFKGDFSELDKRISEANVIGASATLEIDKNRLKTKLYNKKFIPEEEVDHFKGVVFDKPYIKKLIDQDKANKTLSTNNKVYFKDWQRLILLMNDMFFPCPDIMFNGSIKPYVDSDNLVATDNVLIK